MGSSAITSSDETLIPRSVCLSVGRSVGLSSKNYKQLQNFTKNYKSIRNIEKY